MNVKVTISRLNAAEIRASQVDLVALLQDSVAHGASVSFLAPLSDEDAIAYWNKIEVQVAAAQRVVLGALIDGQIIGSVQLLLDMPPNGTHRAEVQKMLVHSAWRRRGIATELLQAAEQAARSLSRSLLVLDTERGSGAEALYERCGYVRAGIIPQFARNAAGDRLVDTVLYYRLLG